MHELAVEILIHEWLKRCDRVRIGQGMIDCLPSSIDVPGMTALVAKQEGEAEALSEAIEVLRGS